MTKTIEFVKKYRLSAIVYNNLQLTSSEWWSKCIDDSWATENDIPIKLALYSFFHTIADNAYNGNLDIIYAQLHDVNLMRHMATHCGYVNVGSFTYNLVPKQTKKVQSCRVSINQRKIEKKIVSWSEKMINKLNSLQ